MPLILTEPHAASRGVAPTFCDVSRHTLMLVDLTRNIRSVRHQCRFGHRGKHTTCRPAKNKFPQPGMPYPPMTMRSAYVSAAYDRIVLETSILLTGMRSHQVIRRPGDASDRATR